MNNSITEESKEAENVYIRLPRFVTESEEIKYVDGKYLPAVVREFEWENLDFTFVISPARVRDENGNDRHYYPGEREGFIECALRRLAARDNINFRPEEYTLGFTLSQLKIELFSITRDFRYELDELGLGIQILADVKYDLVGRSGGSQLYFRPIEKLVIQEKNGEMYYRAQFSQLFFSRTKQFNFCFPGKNSSKGNSLE